MSKAQQLIEQVLAGNHPDDVVNQYLLKENIPAHELDHLVSAHIDKPFKVGQPVRGFSFGDTITPEVHAHIEKHAKAKIAAITKHRRQDNKGRPKQWKDPWDTLR